MTDHALYTKDEYLRRICGELPDTATERAMASPEIVHNEAGVPIIPATWIDKMGENRERDKLWCECLISVLDPKEIQLVLSVFNRERPDQVAEETQFVPELPSLAEVRQRFDNLLSGEVYGKGPDEYNLLIDRLLAATVEQQGGKK